MAGSKFYGLRNKGKKKGKSLNETAELPSTIEINQELVDEQLSAPELTEKEVEDLFSRLNEKPPVDTKKVEAVVNKVIEEVTQPEKAEQLFVAYGLCYNETDKKFVKIEIDFNPKTGYSKLRSIEHYADSAPTALNKLNKILSLKLLKREETYE